MHVSEARIEANKRNALLAKGPTSEAGKISSRKNSLIHGLTSQVVTAERDAQAIARRLEAFTVDLKPKSTAGVALIAQMAALSIRIERAAEHETAAIAHHVRHAIDAFDDERADAAQQLFETLAADPRPALKKLLRTPEGVERLIDAWDDLRSDLIVDAWGTEPLEQAANLSGLKARHARGTLLGALTRALTGDFDALGGDEGAGLDDESRKAWAKARLLEQIDHEIATLDAHYQTFDFEAIELDRTEAPDRALFDASKPACLARRYESEASRRFFRALNEFRKVEAEFAAQAESVPSRPVPAPPEPAPKVGSFREIPPEPTPEPVSSLAELFRPDFSMIRDASGQPLSIGRPLVAAG
jgi:hypothetical protein